MPDTNYDVIINYNSVPSGQAETTGGQIIKNKTVNGFIYQLYNSVNTSGSFNMGYTAIKLVTMEGYTELQNKVNNPDSTPTPNSLNLCTSGGIYDAIQNASSVFVGTRSEWLDEPDKTTFDIAVLTDAPQNINAVDSSTGDLTVVADKTNIWKGTLAEWEALTPSEKDLYEQAEVDDAPMLNPVSWNRFGQGTVYTKTATDVTWNDGPGHSLCSLTVQKSGLYVIEAFMDQTGTILTNHPASGGFHILGGGGLTSRYQKTIGNLVDRLNDTIYVTTFLKKGDTITYSAYIINSNISDTTRGISNASLKASCICDLSSLFDA